MKQGDMLTHTTTTTFPDGRVVVEVQETCQGCEMEESVGGAGSDRLYGTIVDVIGSFLSIASIVLQALR